MFCFSYKKFEKINFKNINLFQTQNIIKVQFQEDTNNQKEETFEEKIKQNETEEKNKENTTEKIEWKIEIPRIFLEAEIAEGTDEKTMNSKVGHFEETSKTTGNICLAAHNRGYPVNYFANLKLIKKGDIIKYQYGNFNKQYEVIKNTIIKDTDWEHLKETEENTITLITCVENEPEYRRCVQAREII